MTTASGFAAHNKRPPDRSDLGTEADKHSFQPRENEIEFGDSVSTLKQQPSMAIHDANDSSVLTAAGAGAGSSGGGGGGTRGQENPAACWRCHRDIVVLEGRGDHRHHPNGSRTGMATTSWDGGGSGLAETSLLSSVSDNDAKDGSSDALDSTYTSRTSPRNHPRLRSFPLSPGADTLLAENSALGTLATVEQGRDPRAADIGTSDKTINAYSAKESLPRAGEEVSLELSSSQLHRYDEEQEGRVVSGSAAVESRGPRRSSNSRGKGCGGRARRQSSLQRTLRRRRSSGDRRGGTRGGKTSLLRGGSLTSGGRRRSRARRRGVGAVAGSGAAAGRRHSYPGDEVQNWCIVPLFSRSVGSRKYNIARI